MLDIKEIRDNPAKIKEVIKNGRGNSKKADVDKLLDLDKKRTYLLSHLQDLNAKRNQVSAEFSSSKKEDLKEVGRKIKQEIQETEKELNTVAGQWQEIMDWMPNIPLDMPIGNGEEDNVVLKVWVPKKGYIKEAVGLKARGQTEKFMPRLGFKGEHHLDLGERLGIIDTKQSSKVSGTRFNYLIGKAPLMQYALQQLLFDKLIREKFTMIVSPTLVKERALYGTSHFPELVDQAYAIRSENVEEGSQLYLVGSSEPSNFAYFMDKTLEEKDLPIKLFAYATAFRSEAGSWGKDTRGIKRVHQFDKIEMNCVCAPEQSASIFDYFLGINEWFLQKLELPYQLVLKCTRDAGYLATAKQVDVEVWLSSQEEFMEVGTDTNTTDYQARRLNIKFACPDGRKYFVHTVNDTGAAMGRMIISILCNYQTKDGLVKVPRALRKFTNFKEINATSRQ